jgi:hypothetical protein
MLCGCVSLNVIVPYSSGKRNSLFWGAVNLLPKGANVELYINRLSDEDVRAIEKRMRPGEYSDGGFLNCFERLQDVIERDAKVVEGSGLTYKQIADKIETIIGKARRHMWLFQSGKSHLKKEQIESFINKIGPGIPIEGKYVIKALAWRGLQDCPYGTYLQKCREEPLYSYLDCELKNTQTGQKVSFPGLIIHLLREHQFFEGSTKYRVEPKLLIEVLDLEVGKDYSPVYIREKIWVPYSFSTSLEVDDFWEEENAIVQYPEKVIRLAENVHIYVGKQKCVLIAEQEMQLEEEFFVKKVKWSDLKIVKGRQFMMVHEDVFIDVC